VTGDELRSLFLSFFEEKGHQIVPSSSLIPQDDPTLLLTSAGMVPFKPYYLGEKKPPHPRLTSCQKCFRTTDIEAVGDPTHLTFFEMLGNFSIGDYFKREAISWGWEFVTRCLKLEPARLWITIYLDDDESFGYWREIGIPAERILRFGEEDNFWGPVGNSGPCGPCSEILYDLGEHAGCGKPTCAPDCSCGRFSEIWNLVFTQYNQDSEGLRTPLPRPNIDTGMGLERTEAAIEGKTSVYETDFFVPLLERVAELTGTSYGANADTDHAMRVVTEHGRGIPFLVADGIMPGNEGRGYVLRRLLRRAVLFSRQLGEGKPFLSEVAKLTIEKMGHIYPEIVQKRDFILKVIEAEQTRFGETLGTGLELLDGIMAEVRSRGKDEIPAEQAFKLYDTYGFPVELTSEIASQQGLTLDLAGFEQEMAKQRERARAAQAVESGEVVETPRIILSDSVKASTFVGYHCLAQRTAVVKLFTGGREVETIEEGQKADAVLSETPFYAEMGGQIGDAGVLDGPSGKFSVTDTISNQPGIIIHQGEVIEGNLSVGDQVEAVVDQERRLDIARNHTATHLLHLALRQVLGEHVEQRGSLVNSDRLRFDFVHLEPLTDEEIAQVNTIVNQEIRQNLGVRAEEVSYRQAVEEGVIALFGEKYGDEVRAIKIGEPAVSAELCGGTHVSATGELGFFHVVSESSIGSGLRRIEAVSGRGAERYANAQFLTLEQIAHSLKAAVGDVTQRVSGLVSELETERRRTLALEKELAGKTISSLLDEVVVVNGVNLLAARVSSCRVDTLRIMSDLLRQELKSAIIVLGTVCDDRPLFLTAVTPDLIARGYHAGEIARKVAGITGGGGGGKAHFAQAGGKDKAKLDEALRLVRDLV
jgi:alanyl-tRNA synthetase